MPLVQVKLVGGVFSAEEKRQMGERLTDAMARISGEPPRPGTRGLTEDVGSGDWGVGGRAVTAETVRWMAGRTPAGT